MVDAVHRLTGLIVIYQNHPFSSKVQKIPSGNHTDIVSVRIKDREIPVTLLAHDSFNVFRFLRHFKGNQVTFFHKMRDRHTLVYHPGHGKCIMRRDNDITVILLRQLADRLGHFGIHTDDDARRIHLYGTELRLVPVAQDHHIPLMDIILHDIRIGCCNYHLAFFVDCALVTVKHNPVKCL